MVDSSRAITSSSFDMITVNNVPDSLVNSAADSGKLVSCLPKYCNIIILYPSVNGMDVDYKLNSGG